MYHQGEHDEVLRDFLKRKKWLLGGTRMTELLRATYPEYFNEPLKAGTMVSCADPRKTTAAECTRELTRDETPEEFDKRSSALASVCHSPVHTR